MQRPKSFFFRIWPSCIKLKGSIQLHASKILPLYTLNPRSGIKRLNIFRPLSGFLPNFIYCLLLSNPHSSSNMDFLWGTITKMADKMPSSYQFACCCHSNLVIFNQISSKFHIWFAFIKFSLKFSMGFVWQMITKITDKNSKMAAAYQFASCGHSNLVIFNQISSKFHI